jgi:hypothetical protein
MVCLERNAKETHIDTGVASKKQVFIWMERSVDTAILGVPGWCWIAHRAGGGPSRLPRGGAQRSSLAVSTLAQLRACRPIP